MPRADNSVKHWQNLPTSNPKSDLLNINTCTKFVKSLDIYTLLSGNENMGMYRTDNSVKIWRNLRISNPTPDFYNINAHTKFCENPLMFTQVIIWKLIMDGQTYEWQTDVLTNGKSCGYHHYFSILMWLKNSHLTGKKPHKRLILCGWRNKSHWNTMQ